MKTYLKIKEVPKTWLHSGLTLFDIIILFYTPFDECKRSIKSEVINTESRAMS